mmetsp:Transcript_27472/g.50092  ORF Transcript_27472/g.50092 Transcript_27472/m.50092 type:complete len:274 (+) Transcript_27472:48-869(+)
MLRRTRCGGRLLGSIQVRVSTLGDRCFDLSVAWSCQGRDLKELLVTKDPTLRVSAMRLLFGLQEIRDHDAVGSILYNSSDDEQIGYQDVAHITLVFRSPPCEKYLNDLISTTSLGNANNVVCMDKECVLARVMIDGRDLRFASPELQNDKDVVTGAVRQRSEALLYASERLQDDNDIFLVAARCHFWKLPHLKVSKRLQALPGFEVLEKRRSMLLALRILFSLILLAIAYFPHCRCMCVLALAPVLYFPFQPNVDVFQGQQSEEKSCTYAHSK